MSSDNSLVVRDTRAFTNFAPTTFADAMTFSRMLAQSAFVPKDFRGKPSEILAAIQYGAELGVGPMQALQNIAVINGKPSVYGDLALALVQASGKLEYIKEHDDGQQAVCTVKRVGDPNPHIVKFSNEDAKRASLLGKAGPWTQYPSRMRMFRARGFALRDKFADVLKGLITREEAEDYPVAGREIPAEAVTTTEEFTPDGVDQTAGEMAIDNKPKPTDNISADQKEMLKRAAASKLGDEAGARWLGEQLRQRGYAKNTKWGQVTVSDLEAIMVALMNEPAYDPDLVDGFETEAEKAAKAKPNA